MFKLSVQKLPSNHPGIIGLNQHTLYLKVVEVEVRGLDPVFELGKLDLGGPDHLHKVAAAVLQPRVKLLAQALSLEIRG